MGVCAFGCMYLYACMYSLDVCIYVLVGVYMCADIRIGVHVCLSDWWNGEWVVSYFSYIGHVS